MVYSLKLPGRTLFGKGALEEAGPYIRALGTRALIVTGRVVQKSDAFASLTRVLSRHSVGWAVFSEIPGEPDDAMVDEGARAYGYGGCDFIIGLGGGSPMDCAKAIAAKVALPGRIVDYAGREIAGKLPALVLIPTTAGSGSEATRYAVITDSQRGVKLLLRGDALIPALAVVDHTFTLSAPPALTAYTGIDALTHAVEAYTSKKATPLTDPYALAAVGRIFESLPKAFSDGSDRAARESMSIASYEAGVCNSNASVTLVHGMSRPIGARFHVPHGLSNAMLLTHCLRFAAHGRPERFARLARFIGAAPNRFTDREAADSLVGAFSELTRTLNIPTLREYGIPEAEYRDAIQQMAREAIESGSPANTLCDVTEDDIIRLYESLY